jgi:hypothetical protein
MQGQQAYGMQQQMGAPPVYSKGIKFTNIRQSMLNLKAHSGFHDLFRF